MTFKFSEMKRKLYQFSRLLICAFALLIAVDGNSQLLEWRLANKVYSSVDPDAGGGAMGSVQFTLQMHTTGGSITATQISTGYSWQSTRAMIPTTPGCAINTNAPANIVLSPAFAGAGFTYTVVSQCNVNNQTAGGRTFDRTASGTLDNGSIVIGAAWVDVFTVTLWALGPDLPEAGYAALNSSINVAPNPPGPGPLSSYVIADINTGNEYQANSLTFSTVMTLSSVVLPVQFAQFDVDCGDKGAILKWSTATEINNSHFEIQKNTGSGWVTIGQVAGAGNSNEVRKYQFIDLEGGNNATYQIKQVDFDGHSSFSAQRNRSCVGRQVNVVLYPVPTNNVLNVAIRTDKQIRTELQVFDISGRIVRRQAVVLNTGTNNLTFDVSNLAVGEYILSSSDKNIQLNKKFTIAR
jgi:hypothetical protein